MNKNTNMRINMRIIEVIKRLPIVKHVLKLIGFVFGYSKCNICGLPWNFCENKIINLNDTIGFFAQCEYCYNKSTAGEILDANLALWNFWKRNSCKLEFTKDEIIDAVIRDLKENDKI